MPTEIPDTAIPLDLLIASQLSKIYNPEPPTDGVVYHYTDFAGLQGILQTHTLRATYNKVMNDFTEQQYAVDVLRERLCELLDASKIVAALNLCALLEQKHYLACFCETDDLLSMWRGYAGRGGGYCLGFAYQPLRSVGATDAAVGRSGPLLVPVSYGVVPPAVESLLQIFVTHPTAAASTLPTLIGAMTPFLPSIIKHKAFVEEREWRTIVRDPAPERIKFRPGTAMIKPFVELSCRDQSLPLVSITFGPTLEREHTAETLDLMLRNHGYPNVAVRSSAIPYRL